MTRDEKKDKEGYSVFWLYSNEFEKKSTSTFDNVYYSFESHIRFCECRVGYGPLDTRLSRTWK